MKLKSIVAATVLSLSCVGSFAETYNFGTILPGAPYLQSVGVNGSFNDVFNFSLVSTSIAGMSILNFGAMPSLLNTTFTSALLFNSANVFMGDLTGTATSLSLLSPTLSAGSYYLSVQGSTTGSLGGGYSAAISVSPVPEPETFAMLLAGLGVIGAITRRRKQTAAAFA